MLSLTNRFAAQGFRVAACVSRFHVPLQLSQHTSVFGKYCARLGSFELKVEPNQSFRSFSALKPVVVEPLENLGENIATATLVSWEKVAGETVEEDDVVAIIETDKVTMDIRARIAGKFVEGLAQPQSEVIVGSPLYKIQPV